MKYWAVPLMIFIAYGSGLLTHKLNEVRVEKEESVVIDIKPKNEPIIHYHIMDKSMCKRPS